MPRSPTPPEPLPDALKNVDVVICLDIYLVHTELDRDVRSTGTRFLNVHPASYGPLRRAFAGVDHGLIKRLGDRLCEILAIGGKCNVTSPWNTDLELDFPSDSGKSVDYGSGREKGV